MQKKYLLGFWVVGIIAVVGLVIFPKWTVDDAFISYRYGHNFAQFGELTYNIGEDPVEGYTGILLPLLAALFIKLGLPLLAAIKILGALAFFGAGLLLAGILRELKLSRGAILVTLALWVFTPFLYLHSLSGLESSWFLLLILAFWWSALKAMRRNDLWGDLRMTLFLLLAALCRPEGLLLLPGALLFFVRKPHRSLRRALVFLLLFVLPGLLYFLWRWDYYGYFFPNTFAVKSYGGLLNGESLRSLLVFLALFVALPLLVAGLAAFLQAKEIQERWSMPEFSIQKDKIKLLTISVSAFVVLGVLLYLRSHLYMNFSYRFWLPFYPAFLILFAVLLHEGWESFEPGGDPRQAIVRKVAVIALLLQILILAFQWKKDFHYAYSYQKYVMEGVYLPTARYIKNRIPADGTMIVYLDAGAVPYYTGLRTIDFGGLNDEKLARGLVEDRIQYFFAQDADIVVMTSEDPDQLRYLEEAEMIVADPRFDKRYGKVLTFGSFGHVPYYHFVYLRRGLRLEDLDL